MFLDLKASIPSELRASDVRLCQRKAQDPIQRKLQSSLLMSWLGSRSNATQMQLTHRLTTVKSSLKKEKPSTRRKLPHGPTPWKTSEKSERKTASRSWKKKKWGNVSKTQKWTKSLIKKEWQLLRKPTNTCMTNKIRSKLSTPKCWFATSTKNVRCKKNSNEKSNKLMTILKNNGLSKKRSRWLNLTRKLGKN